MPSTVKAACCCSVKFKPQALATRNKPAHVEVSVKRLTKKSFIELSFYGTIVVPAVTVGVDSQRYVVAGVNVAELSDKPPEETTRLPAYSEYVDTA